MSFGREERRVLLAAILERRPETLEGLDWEAIAAHARRFGISGLAWNAVGGRGGSPGLEDLRRDAIRDAAQTTLALHAFARVTRALGGAGIGCMALKGVALVALDPTYGSLRSVSDLDLLVRVRDVERADAALVAAGLRRLRRRPTMEGDGGLAGVAAQELVSGVANYEDPAGVPIDLHVRPPARPLPGGEDGLWSRCQVVSAFGTEVRVPGLHDLVAIAADHAIDHHGGEPAMLPRHMADLGRLQRLGALEGGPEPVRPTVTASVRMREAAEAALAAPRAWSVPPRVERALMPGVAAVEGALLRAWYRGRVRGKVLTAQGWTAVFPSRAYLAASYGAPEDAWWLPALHVRRLLWDQPLNVLGWRSRGRRSP